MSRIGTILLLAVVAAFSYFAFYNQEVVSLTLWKGRVVELPVVGVVLLSIGAGAVLVLILFSLRGVRRTVEQIQTGMIKRRRQKAEDLYNRGVDAHLSGNNEKAVKLLEDAVAKDPGYLLPFYRLGKVYQELGQVKKALELHRKALEAHPGNLRILLYLVDDYLAMGELDEASGVLKNIISGDDSNRAAWEALRDIQEMKGDWRGATESQVRLLKITGRKEESLQKLRVLRYQRALSLLAGGDRDRGVRALKEILREDPDFMAAVVTLGETHLREGRLEEGIRILSEGYRRHKNPVYLQVIEEKLITHDSPGRLVEVFRSLLEKSPDDVFLNLFFGKICLRLEMIDEGHMALRKVESMGYESAFLHALLGEINARRDRYKDAIDDFQRYVELSHGTDPRFVCGSCGEVSEGWSARCASCGNWNSYALPGLTEPANPPAVRPQYESEG